MKIVVLVKEVPDTYGERRIDQETGLADRAASESVMDEINERAVEFALSYADANSGTEVVVLSVTPENATATIRKGLAMGATSAVHVVDDALAGADYGVTSEVIAAALRRIGYDLVVAGNLSTDGSGGIIPAMVAELLGIPHATALASVSLTENEVTGQRASDAGTMQVSSPLPAVISITDRLPDARFPNFKGIMAAKKKPLEVLNLADLGVELSESAVPHSIMVSVSERPPRSAGVKIVDEGDAGKKLADFLAQNRLV